MGFYVILGCTINGIFFTILVPWGYSLTHPKLMESKECINESSLTFSSISSWGDFLLDFTVEGYREWGLGNLDVFPVPFKQFGIIPGKFSKGLEDFSWGVIWRPVTLCSVGGVVFFTFSKTPILFCLLIVSYILGLTPAVLEVAFEPVPP